MDIPLPDCERMVYFSPPRITWSKLENTPLRFDCRPLYKVTRQGATLGGGIPIRRSSVEIISIVVDRSKFTCGISPIVSGWLLVSSICSLLHSFHDTYGYYHNTRAICDKLKLFHEIRNWTIFCDFVMVWNVACERNYRFTKWLHKINNAAGNRNMYAAL